MAHNSAYFEEEKLANSYDIKMLTWLYPFTKPYRLLLSGSIFLVVFITLLDLALPYVTKIAIDRYIVPRMDSSISTTTDSHDSKTGQLHVNIANSGTREIVQKYSNFFTIDGTTAFISFDDLKKLEKSDIVILRKEDLAGISVITLIFLALIGANFVLNFIQVMIMEYTGQMIMHDLRVKLFEHIQSRSVAFFTRHPVGRLVTRVANDTQNMHELVTSIVAFVFKDIFLLTGITGMACLGITILAMIEPSVCPCLLAISRKLGMSALA